MSDLYCSDDWVEICRKVSVICNSIFPYVTKKAVRSAIVSAVFEIQAEEHFKEKGLNVQSSRNDQEPDLYFKDDDLMCEIKVTGLDALIVDKPITWLGGRYSKRNSDHIFIGWNYCHNQGLFKKTSMSFFVLKTYVTEDDWKDLSNSKNYYGVGFKSILFDTREVDMLVGEYVGKKFVLRSFYV